jgi:hypothetical protein
MKTSRAKTVVGLFTLALGAAWACSNRVADHSSETNWFDSCETDGDCSVGTCLCGVCSESCSEDANCPGVYTCAGSGSGAFTRLCKGVASAPEGVCLKGCGSGSACPTGFECESDACVPKARAASGPPSSEQTLSGNSWVALLATGPESGFLTGRCMPRSLPVDSEGHVSCTAMAFRSGSPGCRCDEAGFGALAADALRAGKDRLQQAGVCDVAGQPACDDLCGCELLQKTGSDLETCQQQDGTLNGAAGWCYIDPSQGAGSSSLVASCPQTQRRVVRVEGISDQTLVLACTSTTPTRPPQVATPGGMGDPCIPGDEFRQNFSGYGETEVNIESGSPSCSTGICLVAHFAGRTTCPYGQPGVTVDGVTSVDPSLGPDERCYLPGASHEPANEITVPVAPQLVARSPEKSVYCSCRCDGPAGEGPFCACPSGFECAHLVDSYGTAGGAQFTGSYCIKAGTGVPDPGKIPQNNCSDPGGDLPPPGGCGDR